MLDRQGGASSPFFTGLGVEFFEKERRKRAGRRDEKSFSFFDCLFRFLSPFFLSAMADLADFISFSSVEALNENPEHTFQNALKKVRKTTREGRGRDEGGKSN